MEFYGPQGLIITGTGRVLNLSTMGARVQGNVELQTGENFRVALYEGQRLFLELPAKVVWITKIALGYVYGVQFTNVSPQQEERLKRVISSI